MKKFKTYLKQIWSLAYGSNITRFEDRTILITVLSVSILLLIATIPNIIFGLGIPIILFTGLGSLFFFCLYLVGRFMKMGSIYNRTATLLFIVYLDLLWFLNFGSRGPVMPYFVVFYAFLILVFERKYFIMLSIILCLNLVGLYLIERHFSTEIGQYANDSMRLDDNFLGMFFGLLLISFFMGALKNNYLFEFERAKRADHLKSAFLANMSHEIRTPLNAIVGFSSLISDPDIPESEKVDFVGQIERNSDYLLCLIEDIIDLSKIESNQLTVKPENVDVVPLIKQLIQTFNRAILPEKDVEVISNLQKSKILVYVDRVRLEQILRNLLSNAMKFTEEGTIEVGCQRVNEFYTFSVKDTGIGIHSDHHEEIFDRFIKIDNNKQHLYRGTGIGLFLSKQLVEMFGGKIWLESEVGKGSTFYFTIPV